MTNGKCQNPSARSCTTGNGFVANHMGLDLPRYNMKCSGGNVILRGIFHVVSGFTLHYMLNRGNLDCFFNSIGCGGAALVDVG